MSLVINMYHKVSVSCCIVQSVCLAVLCSQRVLLYCAVNVSCCIVQSVCLVLCSQCVLCSIRSLLLDCARVSASCFTVQKMVLLSLPYYST